MAEWMPDSEVTPEAKRIADSYRGVKIGSTGIIQKPEGAMSPRYGVTKQERTGIQPVFEKMDGKPDPEAGLARELRREKVLTNWMAGYSMRQIAQALQVSYATVRDDIEAIAADWRDRNVGLYAAIEEKNIARCEAIIAANFKGTIAQEQRATENMLKAMREEREWLDRGAPKVSVNINASLKSAREMTDEELLDEIRERHEEILKVVDADGYAVDGAQAD